MNVTFDKSSFPALSQVESSSDDDNSVNDSCSYESSKNESIEHDDVEVDISDLGGDGNDEDSSELRDVSTAATTLA